VDTEEEAEALVLLHCALDHSNRWFRIRPTWSAQDVTAAIAAARRQFRLEEIDMAEPKKPKQKTKKIPFEKVAVEVTGMKGVWEWECGGVRWRYYDEDRGINLEARQTGDDAKDDWHPLVHVSDIKSAGLFSEGFSAGYQAGAQAT
jgi:hypothetical protein